VGAVVEIGFTQGPYKLNDRFGKTNYPGTIDFGFTVLGSWPIFKEKIIL
jgi:hypothetical protein